MMPGNDRLRTEHVTMYSTMEKEYWENPEPDRTEQRAIHASMTY